MGDVAELNLLSRPLGTHCRQRGNEPRIGINSTERVGVPALRAARVEQEIVKVPQNEAVVALANSQAIIPRRVDLENDPAIHQQGEQFVPRKIVLLTELLHRLRCRQQREGNCNFRIANPKQRASQRRFQNHVVAAPPHVSKSRQSEHVSTVQLRHARPIVGNLWFDDDLIIVARAPERELQQAVHCQSPDQASDLLADVRTFGVE